MSLLKRAASNARELRYIAYGQGDPYGIPSNGSLLNYSATGLPVDANTAQGLAAWWACTRILSTLIGSMPIHTYATTRNGKLTQTDQHPFIDNPFGDMTGTPVSRQDGFEQVMMSLLGRGNAISYISERDRLGYPTQMMVVNPDVARIQPDPGTGAKTLLIGGQKQDLHDFVHIMGVSMPGMYVGMSPVAYLRQTIGIGLATEEFAARFYGKGATMSGVIELDGDLDPDAARQLKERFQARHAGLTNAHSIGVLTGGAKFRPLSISPDDAQFIETRRMTIAEVGMIFGVPPHLLGNVQDVSAAWGMGIEPQNMAFLTYTLRPWLTRLETALSNCLPLGLVARFDTEDLLRTDSTARSRYYNAGRQGGWLMTNEIRDREGLPPVDGGDDPFAPLNSAHNGQNDQTDVNANQPKE